jgi:hypothetical protein
MIADTIIKFALESTIKVISTVEVNILSAIGSSAFPIILVALYFLARKPSRKSVTPE